MYTYSATDELGTKGRRTDGREEEARRRPDQARSDVWTESREPLKAIDQELPIRAKKGRSRAVSVATLAGVRSVADR